MAAPCAARAAVRLSQALGRRQPPFRSLLRFHPIVGMDASSRTIHHLSDTAKAFHDLEHRRWQEAGPAYNKGWSKLTQQCLPAMLEAAGVKAGSKVLDIATGPGHCAELAAQRGAKVVAADFSANMLAIARERLAALAGDIEFVEANATNMPFDDDSFDAILCNFGVLHLPVPADFFKEAKRVLRPGGRLAFTVWAEPPKTEAFELILGAVRRQGNHDVPLPEGPPMFLFANPVEAARHMEAAGLVDAETKEVPQHWVFTDASDVWKAFRDGTGRTAALLAAQTPAQLVAIEADLISGLEAFRKGANSEIVIEMPCAMTVARKP